MLKYFLFFMFLLYVIKSNKEGFINLFNKNLNESNKPDNKKFYPMLEINKIKNNNEENYSLIPNNYTIINQKIEDPPNGFFSRNTKRLAQKLNVYEPVNYFKSPISTGASNFNLSYETQFDHTIIKDKNTKDLLIKEDNIDKSTNNPYYYHSHPNNINIIIHSKEFNNKMLREKEFKSNIQEDIYNGEGIHPLNTE